MDEYAWLQSTTAHLDTLYIQFRNTEIVYAKSRDVNMFLRVQNKKGT